MLLPFTCPRVIKIEKRLAESFASSKIITALLGYHDHKLFFEKSTLFRRRQDHFTSFSIFYNISSTVLLAFWSATRMQIFRDPELQPCRPSSSSNRYLLNLPTDAESNQKLIENNRAMLMQKKQRHNGAKVQIADLHFCSTNSVKIIRNYALSFLGKVIVFSKHRSITHFGNH